MCQKMGGVHVKSASVSNSHFSNFSGPAGVGVNELRRRLIASNPREFQSAIPRM